MRKVVFVTEAQPLILEPSGRLGRVHVFSLSWPATDPRPSLSELSSVLGPQQGVFGLGFPLCARLGVELPGLRIFPALSGPGPAVPSTQGALLCIALGDDRGVLVQQTRALQRVLDPSFELSELVDTFVYREGRDLSGYLDGTENPVGERALQAAVIAGRGPGLDGGSFVAVQRWTHDLNAFERNSPVQRDHIVGRSLETNEELADAPPSAHVKRSAQESFDPPAFMLRRSMPFVAGRDHGLCFIAYGESLDRYERVLKRMIGLEDGVVDGLFSFSRPVTGGYYFCPPASGAGLDLRSIGL